MNILCRLNASTTFSISFLLFVFVLLLLLLLLLLFLLRLLLLLSSENISSASPLPLCFWTVWINCSHRKATSLRAAFKDSRSVSWLFASSLSPAYKAANAAKTLASTLPSDKTFNRGSASIKAPSEVSRSILLVSLYARTAFCSLMAMSSRLQNSSKHMACHIIAESKFSNMMTSSCGFFRGTKP